ncbi:MAG: hypothetical protein IPK07_11400 [Deltaproteobacteria bacterium]|nr:hypothetical protein [Deltaproteobacteria bacterium]
MSGRHASPPTPASLAEFRRGGPVTTYTKTLRVHHQVLAACVMALIVSGFSLQSEAVSRVGRYLGSAAVLGVVHRIAAIVLVVMFVHHLVTVAVPAVLAGLAAARGAKAGVIARLGAAWRAIPMLPNLDDARDALHTVRYFAGREPRDHRAGRWHYRSKLHYMAIVWGVPAMGLTGLILALPTVVPFQLARVLGLVGLAVEPRTLVAIAEIVHSHEAYLVVIVSVVWHFYRVLVPPRRDVFSGQLTLAEMRRWHPEWYDAHVAALGYDPLASPP